MLSYAKKEKNTQQQNTNRVIKICSIENVVCPLLNNLFDKNNLKIRLRKKTEHTNIARSSQNSVHQNIHVMLSSAKIPKNRNKKTKFTSGMIISTATINYRF